MATARRFEDLACWQEGKKLVNLVYQLSSKKEFADFSLKDQIRRASVSIISNIAEGFERGTREEFIHFLYIAKASCGEVRAQFYVALDQSFIDKNSFEKGAVLAKRVSAIIYKLIESLKSSRFKGLKYKRAPQKDPWEEFMKKSYPKIYGKLKQP